MTTKEMLQTIGMSETMEVIGKNDDDAKTYRELTTKKLESVKAHINFIVERRKTVKVSKEEKQFLTQQKAALQARKKILLARLEAVERRETIANYLHRAADAYKTALQEASANHVFISKGNDKMGDVKSISMPTGLTCYSNGKLPYCAVICYARKTIDGRLPELLKHNVDNLAIYKTDPTRYWAEVKQAVADCFRFRFDVSGDIPDGKYFDGVIETAQDSPHCEILVFTKQYKIVNKWIDAHGELPENLHVMFSLDAYLPMDNPHNLPEARIFDGDCPNDWTPCHGRCEECFRAKMGCIGARHGDVVGLPIH